MRRLILLSRPGCDLCEEMEDQLRAAFAGLPFELRKAAVDSNPDWRRRYGLRIPVLLDEDGERLAEGHLDEDALGAIAAALVR